MQSSPPTINAVKPGLSTNRTQNYEFLVGKWYEIQPTKEGGIRQTLSEKKQNGTYLNIFRIKSANGKNIEQEEVGEWGICGDIYFTIFKGWIINGRFIPAGSGPYNYDGYHILKLTSKNFEYVNAETKDHFFAKKVSSDFALPGM